MEITKKTGKEGLIQYAERLSRDYTENYTLKNRKTKGQFFTPSPVSKFMSDLFLINKNSIRMLDPGAGTGILTAAFCELLLDTDKKIDLTIDVYENDPNLIPLLKNVLNSCKNEMEEKGHDCEYTIYVRDFILQNGGHFRNYTLHQIGKKRILYDYIISNPPYYKLNKDSIESAVMKDLVSGQPNIYAFFMALSTSILKPEGEMVFITPRSYCSGLYYSKFRKWFLDNIKIQNIHIFESRKDVFDQDGVLQENIIIKCKKNKNKDDEIVISSSNNKNLKEMKEIKVKKDKVIYHKNGDIFIRIPTSSLDSKIIEVVDDWPNTLSDLKLKISTGPVIPFRTRKHLQPNFDNNKESAPLLWMHNMKDMHIKWPLSKNNKEEAILLNKNTERLLLPTKNYVLVKRFSSKEQNRRLYASVLLESDLKYSKIGIENHINYIYKENGDLTREETFGIASILNSAFIDNYFRSLNGNTQVNATDVRCLPFPDIEKIKRIGREIYKSKIFSAGYKLDKIVANNLNIDENIIKKLYDGDYNDKN